MTTLLFDNEKPIDCLLSVIDELNYVKTALYRLQDRLTDEEYLSAWNQEQLLKLVLDEGLQMTFFLKRFEDIIEAAGEVNRYSKK